MACHPNAEMLKGIQSSLFQQSDDFLPANRALIRNGEIQFRQLRSQLTRGFALISLYTPWEAWREAAEKALEFVKRFA